MRGSAIYTQISWATICILSQGLKEWICNVFFPLCLSYLGRETCVKWQCYHNSCLLLELVIWLCTRACWHTGLIWGILIGREDTFLEVSKYRTNWDQNTGSTNLRWPWLDVKLRWIDMWWLLSLQHLQAVKLVLNTLWEAQWALGIFPAIDEMQ